MASWVMFGCLFSVTYYLLRNVFISEWILTVGIGMLAWTLADLFTKTIVNTMPKMKIDPSDKAVFITGCDSGFGFELAKDLDSLGFHVYAGCLLPDKEGAKQLQESCSDRLQIVPLDVTDEDQVNAAAKQVASTLDGKVLWALVNNAGIATFTEIEWCPVETYHKIFNVNALGPIRMTKAFLPLLRESHGRVVIVASLAGRYTFPGFSAYSMSKYAAVSFADALRREMRKWNISVHTVEPSLYKTPIAGTERMKSILQSTWDNTPSDIQETYGEEYYQAFQKRMMLQLKLARNNIQEVVNDMTDAVAGTRPKTRYVPSLAIQFRAKILETIPTEVQDFVLCLTQPRCPPKAKQNKIDSLRPEFRRAYSEPVKMTKMVNDAIRSISRLFEKRREE